MKPSRRTPRFFSITFRMLLVLTSCAMLLSYISIYINPSHFALPMFFGLFFIPIAFINLFLLAVALARGSRSAWIPLITLLPVLLFAESFFKIGNGEMQEEAGKGLKIESYNIGMFASSQNGQTREECCRQIAGHLREENPAIVCFQEFYVADYRECDSFLAAEYPYRFYRLFRTRDNHLFGNMILSRCPIVEEGSITFPSSTNLSIFTDLKIGEDTIRIYNNHLESYNISFTSIIKKWAGSQQLAKMHEKMKGTTIKRSDQVNTILEHIESSRHPVIICGDFNDTPISYTYHKLAQGRKDSFREAGKGFAATFAPAWPLLRIDYILFPKQFRGISHTTPRTGFSDHYPVIAEIDYRNATEYGETNQ